MNTATAKILSFPEPEYADGGGGGGGGCFEDCQKFYLDFITELILRVRARGDSHGAVIDSEMAVMLMDLEQGTRT